MKRFARFLILLAAAWPVSSVLAARLAVTVTHTLSIARPSETISVPWTRVADALPGALIHHLAVKDAAGRVLPYQVTNVDPTLKDATGRGAAYGELLFQHDFAVGEKSAVFTIDGRDEPTLLISNDLTTPGKNLFARYAERMMVKTNWTPSWSRSTSTPSPAASRSTSASTPPSPSSPAILPGCSRSTIPVLVERTTTRNPLAGLPGRNRHPAHRRQRGHLRAEPPQPPPCPHRRRIRRPANRDPLVGRPQPALPIPAPVTTKPAGNLNSII